MIAAGGRRPPCSAPLRGNVRSEQGPADAVASAARFPHPLARGGDRGRRRPADRRLLIGIINRYREGGALLALTSATGVPGLMLLDGGGVAALGVPTHHRPCGGRPLVVAVASSAGLGLRAEAGTGPTAVLEVMIGLLDELLRLFSNVFSFARLAAFGLMHAAIGQVVLHAAGSLTGTPIGDLGAALTFAVGWAAAFALEGLVVAVQALRLEYYELFSRLFVREGRPFRPFRLPLISTKEAR